MRINNFEFNNFSNEKTLRNDFIYINYLKKISRTNYYSFSDLFNIVNENDNGYQNEDFLYVQIGDTNNVNEVFPNELNLDNRDTNIINEPLYKKISKGDIIKCKENDILISKIRPNLKKILFIDNKLEEIYFTSAFISIRPKYMPKILYYCLRTIFFEDLLSLSRQGKGYPTLSEKDLQSMRFNKTVIDYLIKNENTILLKIEKLEKEIEKLKDNLILENIVINDVFTNTFNFNIKKFEELKKNKNYNSSFSDFSYNSDMRFSVKFNRPAGQFVMSELNNISNKKLKNIISEPILLGASISPSEFNSNGDFYYISMATIKNWKVELDESQLLSDEYVIKNENKKVKKNDIIMTRSGVAIGKFAFVEEDINGIYADFTMRIRIKDYNPLFAYYYFRTTYFQYLIEIYKRGVQNQNIYPSVIQEFPIPDINATEQLEIVKTIKNEIDKQNNIKNEVYNKRLEIEKILLETINEIKVDKKEGKKMKVLIYSRVALNDNNKLDKNIEEMKEYIKSQPDWELKDVYSEVASGLDNSRTEYNKLIKDIEEKTIDIVIVKNVDSLSRDVVEFLNLINLLEKNNVKLFVLENKDFFKK